MSKRSSASHVFVHAEDRLVAARLLSCRFVGEVGDAPLEPALLDQLDRAAVGVDVVDDLEDLALVLGRQALDEIRAAERIDDRRDAGLVGDDLLRAQRDLHRLLGGNREGLVHAVGVQALRPAQHRRERLQAGAHDVDLVLRLGQRRGGGLAVEAQAHRLRIARAEALLHDLRVDPPHGAELRDLLEEIGLGHVVEREPGANSSTSSTGLRTSST